jgi:hypothetical protein
MGKSLQGSPRLDTFRLSVVALAGLFAAGPGIARFLSFWLESQPYSGPCNAPATEKQQILHLYNMLVNSLELIDK